MRTKPHGARAKPRPGQQRGAQPSAAGCLPRGQVVRELRPALTGPVTPAVWETPHLYTHPTQVLLCFTGPPLQSTVPSTGAQRSPLTQNVQSRCLSPQPHEKASIGEAAARRIGLFPQRSWGCSRTDRLGSARSRAQSCDVRHEDDAGC